jgi:hypothetical protein
MCHRTRLGAGVRYEKTERYQKIEIVGRDGGKGE